MDTLAGGFPHSDIFGSMLVCELPEAFRTLQRPSSPVIAKASTTCTYSLDPITLPPRFKAVPVNRERALVQGFVGLGRSHICNHYPCIDPWEIDALASSKLLKNETASGPKDPMKAAGLSWNLFIWWR